MYDPFFEHASRHAVSKRSRHKYTKCYQIKKMSSSILKHMLQTRTTSLFSFPACHKLMFIHSPLPSLPDVVVMSSQPGKPCTVLMNLLCKAVSFSFGRLEQMPYGMYFKKCKHGERGRSWGLSGETNTQDYHSGDQSSCTLKYIILVPKHNQALTISSKTQLYHFCA